MAGVGLHHLPVAFGGLLEPAVAVMLDGLVYHSLERRIAHALPWGRGAAAPVITNAAAV